MYVRYLRVQCREFIKQPLKKYNLTHALKNKKKVISTEEKKQNNYKIKITVHKAGNECIYEAQLQ